MQEIRRPIPYGVKIDGEIYPCFLRLKVEEVEEDDESGASPFHFWTVCYERHEGFPREVFPRWNRLIPLDR